MEPKRERPHSFSGSDFFPSKTWCSLILYMAPRPRWVLSLGYSEVPVRSKARLPCLIPLSAGATLSRILYIGGLSSHLRTSGSAVPSQGLRKGPLKEGSFIFFFASSAMNCLPGVRTLRPQGQGPGRLEGCSRYLGGYHGKMPQQCGLDDPLG